MECHGIRIYSIEADSEKRVTATGIQLQDRADRIAALTPASSISSHLFTATVYLLTPIIIVVALAFTLYTFSNPI